MPQMVRSDAELRMFVLSSSRSMSDEWQMVRDALNQRGVSGFEDLGRFVNNTEHFRPSALDERAAMPVFIELLPRLSDPKLVGAVASHLRRPWARPTAYEVLLNTFERWAALDATAAWHIGDALASAATKDDVSEMLGLATATKYGIARQMIVDSLWRFKADTDVEPVLVSLINDPDVALHAMSALRRAVGPDNALPHLRRAAEQHSGDKIGAVAQQQIRKAEAALRDKPG
jgi:hypothetical protein